MKIILGRQIEEIKKKKSESEKNLLKNRNSDELNELDANDVYFHSNAVKNIKLGTQLVYRIYLNNNIVYKLEDTINLSLFHSLIPAATTSSVIFDKLENQNISNYNLIGFCDANNHVAVYQNNTEYLVLNIRNAVIYAPDSCSKFLYDYTVLTHCVFNYFNTSNVVNMVSMFSYCSGLTSLDLTSFNTANVTNMGSMFSYCSGLTSLDLTSFNTANVTNMGSMFRNCSGLTSLDLTSFNTANVKYMSYMFSYCSGLTSLDLTSFNTANVTDMVSMFRNCSSLITIISNSFVLKIGLSSSYMFYSCTALVGGNGTTYNSSHSNAEYARVDGENNLPGYFTAPAANNNK